MKETKLEISYCSSAAPLTVRVSHFYILYFYCTGVMRLVGGVDIPRMNIKNKIGVELE